MNDLFLPTNLLSLPGDTGVLVFALILGALTAIFALGMERRRPTAR